MNKLPVHSYAAAPVIDPQQDPAHDSSQDDKLCDHCGGSGHALEWKGQINCKWCRGSGLHADNVKRVVDVGRLYESHHGSFGEWTDVEVELESGEYKKGGMFGDGEHNDMWAFDTFEEY